MKYAEIAVNSPVARPRTFSYAIPGDMSLSPGQAVWVPFGSRRLQGIVFEIVDQPSVEETKEVAEVIEPRPLLSTSQVELARWMGERYLSSFFDAAALMLPPGFERRLLTFFYPIPSPPTAILTSLTPRQKGVLNLIQRKGRVELRQLKKALGGKETETITSQLLRKGLVTKTQELEKAKVKPRAERYLSLAVEAERAWEAVHLLEKKRALKQADLLRLLVTESQSLPLSQVRRRLGFLAGVVSALRDKGLVSIEEVRVQRDPLAHRTFARATPHSLTPSQEAAWRQVQSSLMQLASAGFKPASPSVFLLHGVTGSGKTEIYLRALAQAVSLGKRGIVLVPEIALTPQTINRFAARFPNRVAVLHSRLSLGEQFDEWQRIRDGAFDVVIGSRGALFAPQPDLGLIVIDEMHEWTYKQQEQSPRYHTCDVAIKLAELTGAVVVLGSATPDVVSYHQSRVGEYRLLELPERVSGQDAHLPEVEVVDLRKELKEGNRSIFSRSLTRAIGEALAAQEQVILFLNRRGAATFVQCRDCGFVMRCRRCHVSLTYHSDGGGLICHHCNYRANVPSICPNCLGQRIKFLGLGTQRVEVEVARLFPEARLLRWDRDVTRGKHSHEQILEKFLAHEADILIGTQMIAKGLDIPLVTLVGVINADVGLHLPDFRAGERIFQILTQVAGRAGRGVLGGRAIIQSYTPDHYAIAAAAGHDYDAFYQREIYFRRQHGNPPFNRLARLLYAHTNVTLCQKESERVYRLLREERDAWGLPNTTLIGPSPAYVERVRGRFRWQIIIRDSDPLRLLSKVPVPQGWVVDIDPVSLL